MYYDGTRYYSREVAPTGFRAVIVYQREGKYYLPDEDGERSHSHHGHGRDREDRPLASRLASGLLLFSP